MSGNEDPLEDGHKGVPKNSGHYPKGRSGNLRGRPRKQKRHVTSQQLRTDVLLAAEQEMTITVGGKRTKVPIMGVIYQQLFMKAAQGDVRCIVEAIKLHNRIMDEHSAAKGSILDSVIERTNDFINDPDSFTDPQKRALINLRKAVFDHTVVF